MPDPLSSPLDIQAAGLINEALRDNVVLYVGAGVSLSAGLPSGGDLARLVYAQIEGMGVDLTDIAEDDLLAIADAAEAANGGDARAVQEIALGVANFDGANPSATHRSLMLLLLEGAATVMSTNWDTCIERSTPKGEALAVIVTDADRMTIRTRGLLKVHGCARRPTTALVTSSQLEETPVWASAEMSSRLSHATVIFVGIGDIAPYVKVRLGQLVGALGSIDNVSVVSRRISTHWQQSGWSEVLPHLSEARKIGSSADEYLDGFLRAWVRRALDRVRTLADDMQNEDISNALDHLLTVVLADTAPNVVEWLRRSWRTITVGTSAVHEDHTHLGLIALGSLTAPHAIVQVPLEGPAVSGERKVDLFISPELAGPKVAQAARDRVADYRTRGILGPDELVTIVCAGQIGPLEPSTRSSLVSDVVGGDSAGNVVTGPYLGPIDLLAAHSVLEGIARD